MRHLARPRSVFSPVWYALIHWPNVAKRSHWVVSPSLHSPIWANWWSLSVRPIVVGIRLAWSLAFMMPLEATSIVDGTYAFFAWLVAHVVTMFGFLLFSHRWHQLLSYNRFRGDIHKILGIQSTNDLFRRLSNQQETPPANGTRRVSFEDSFLVLIPRCPLLMGQDKLYFGIYSSHASHHHPQHPCQWTPTLVVLLKYWEKP